MALPAPAEFKQKPVIMLICGSARKESWNMKLAKACAAAILGVKGPDGNPCCDVIGADESIELMAKLPLYNQDDEDARGGQTKEAQELRKLIDRATGFVFITPEYNGGPTPLMTNFCATLSREVWDTDKWANEGWRGKTAAIINMSTGQYGGIRVIQPFTLLLMNMQINLLGNRRAFGHKSEAEDPFQANANGDLEFKQGRQQKQMLSVVKELCKAVVVQKLAEQYSFGDLGPLGTLSFQEPPNKKVQEMQKPKRSSIVKVA